MGVENEINATQLSTKLKLKLSLAKLQYGEGGGHTGL